MGSLRYLPCGSELVHLGVVSARKIIVYFRSVESAPHGANVAVAVHLCLRAAFLLNKKRKMVTINARVVDNVNS